jgi:hypothetical protein
MDRRTVDRTETDVLVRFACATPEHLASAAPSRFGLLVSHHGTFGYCPVQTAGPHHWKDIQSTRLSELRRTLEYPHLGY